jgi:agarase
MASPFPSWKGPAQDRVVGHHWFTHVDQPSEGRFDGENSNYGVVNIRDEAYAPLVDAMTRLNREAVKLRAEAE